MSPQLPLEDSTFIIHSSGNEYGISSRLARSRSESSSCVGGCSLARLRDRYLTRTGLSIVLPVWSRQRSMLLPSSSARHSGQLTESRGFFAEKSKPTSENRNSAWQFEQRYCSLQMT